MLLIGHRGARREAPENTLGGFKHIVALGLKAVEFDVRLLLDHQLAVIHDDNFVRTSGQNQFVHLTSTDELTLIDNRQGWPNWPQAEATPTLAQVLELIEPFQHIEIEVKAVNDDHEAETMVHQLHKQLGGWQHQVTITSFDLKVLDALQRLDSPYKRGLLIELPFGDVVIQMAKQYGCQHIGLKDALTTEDLVHKIKIAGLFCSVWTVNDVDRAKELSAWGVDGLISDVPTTMLQANIPGLSLHCAK